MGIPDHILIVGAGPVGLTTALLLQQAGIPFTLIEANSELPEDLRASTFHPPTLDMLDRVGVAKPLIELGLKSPTWQVRMHRTGERAVFDLSAIGDATCHPYRLQCEQAKLCRILLDRILAAGGDVRMGMRVEAVSQNGSGVRVDARGEDGEAAEFTGTYVVGADGARSAVRRALNFRFEGKTYPETTILATTHFPFEAHLPGLSNVNYVWKDGGTFSLLRLPDLWRCSLYPDEGETIDQALDPESINRKLQEIAPSPTGHDVKEFRPYRIHMRIVDEYRSGRVLLAGDAAHVNSPSGGMGMNGGIHDAFELVATLTEVLNGAPMELLDRYTRRRRPIAEDEILVQADRNRARMQERDEAKRREMLASLQRIADDHGAARDHLLRTSMIAGLRRAAAIA
jgi:2-polyprenyl-6-methoxyphenol hydroxylase-like FAD-dependent oxidoreductase